MFWVVSVVRAADIAGQWHAQFESPRGFQKYQFTFQTIGEKLTGKVTAEVEVRKRETDLLEGKIAGDEVSFVERLSFQGKEVRVRYTGKVKMNSITFAREAGDFGEVEFIAVPGETATPTNAAQSDSPRRRTGESRTIELSLDDKPAFAEPPADIVANRESVAHGKLEMVEYDSKTVAPNARCRFIRRRGIPARRSIPCCICCMALAEMKRNGSGLRLQACCSIT
ncbi:MAG: hypothetical protein QM813_19180 [Verrucomicrobiota bacterium]